MAQKKKRPNARERRNGFMINILTLIVLILLVFEGKSLISLFSSQTIQDRIKQEESEVFAGANLTEAQTEPQSEATGESTSSGKTETGTDEQKEASSETQKAADTDLSTGLPDDDASYLDVVVPAQDTPVDDSYFEDAVFIGDSRMQGFRNLSGITKGSFVTAVGMELENFYTDAQIATAAGNVKVLDALKNLNYSKIYMMLGTNELGAYDMSQVGESYRQVLNDIKQLSSSTEPVVYVYSVIYVDESLVTTGDYVNNANVDAVYKDILNMCQEEGYHYINLNEVLSNGYHSLISGAADDGIHLNTEYCKDWLNYTKTHYIPGV